MICARGVLALDAPSGRSALASHDTLEGQVGNFYGNVTLLGAELDAVQAVSPRPAFLLVDGDSVVVFAEADDDGAPRSGQELSAALGCVAVSVAVHDDDIFFFEVHDKGESALSGAVPDPSAYFGFDAAMHADLDPSMIEGLEIPGPTDSTNSPDAAALVVAVGRGDVEAVRDALERDFVFATERHEAITSALGLPRGAVGWGFRYLSSDDSGYTGPTLLRT